jgi:hypothetical protein
MSKTWGVAMTRGEYYRRLAEFYLAVCLLEDQMIEEALVAKALEFLEMAERVERSDEVPGSPSATA